MKTLVLCGILLTLAGQAADQRSCDCNHWPWPATCKDKCNARVLNEATVKEMQTRLNIPEKTAEKIHAKRSTGDLKSVSDLSGVLTKEEYKTVETRLSVLKVSDARAVLNGAAAAKAKK
jgi:hypothetical protein